MAIARALVHEPMLVLADEPTGALDTANGTAVLDLLSALNDDGTTIAVITHDRDIASMLPRTVELRDGRIVADTRAEAQAESRAEGRAEAQALADTQKVRKAPA